jgi:hypothetical protein
MAAVSQMLSVTFLSSNMKVAFSIAMCLLAESDLTCHSRQPSSVRRDYLSLEEKSANGVLDKTWEATWNLLGK